MTGVSGAGASVDDLVRDHGPRLHRTAVMLTGDGARAEGLLAAVLTDPVDARLGSTADELHGRLVRQFLRTARTQRRDRLVVHDRQGDVGDLVHDLPAGLRAAVVLHLGAGWPVDRSARAAHVRETRLRELVTTVPELGDAVTAVADRLARSDEEIVRDLRAVVSAAHVGAVRDHGQRAGRGTTSDASAVEDGVSALPVPGRGESGVPAYLRRTRRPWRWVAAAGALALVGGVALLVGPEPADDGPTTAQTSMAERGWVVDADGAPPKVVDGLRLAHATTIDYEDPDRPLSVPVYGGQSGQSHARWMALWCDLPAVDDTHLRVPEMTLTLRGSSVTVPCAGRAGTPALTALTALPMGFLRDVAVSWSGDLPGRGSATLAVYDETDPWSPGTAEGTQPVPEVPDGSVAIDTDDLALSWWDGPIYTQQVEVGHDSVITAWAGSSVALGLLVDGINLTDDGDVMAWERGTGGDLWRDQDPQLREGRWFVDTPDQARVFPLPEEVRPAPGQRQTVAVSVPVAAQSLGDPFRETDGPELRWQVQVSDATAAAVDTDVLPLRAGPPAPLDGSAAPRQVGGYRLVGHWKVPADGTRHAVANPADDGLPVLAVAPVSGSPEEGIYNHLAVGVMESQQGVMPLMPGAPVEEVIAWASDPWMETGLSGPPGTPASGTLSILVPATPGHRDADVVGYVPVPYEDFDFAGAPVLPNSWPADEPSPYGGPGEGGPETLAEGTPDDEGRIAFGTRSGSPGMLQITSQGKGRLRALVDGRPVLELARSHGGWWSSWTDEHVTSIIDLGMLPAAGELVVEVEGWEEGYQIDLLRW